MHHVASLRGLEESNLLNSHNPPPLPPPLLANKIIPRSPFPPPLSSSFLDNFFGPAHVAFYKLLSFQKKNP